MTRVSKFASYGIFDAAWSDAFIDDYVSQTDLSDQTIMGNLLINQILERILDAGVTVDGVLLKDGVIPDSAYPNAVLKDGTRAMTGNFVTNNRVDFTYVWMESIYQGGLIQKALRIFQLGTSTLANIQIDRILANRVSFSSPETAYIDSRLTNTSAIVLNAYQGGAIEVARVQSHASAANFSINRAGDITMLDQKMMTLGTYTDAQRPAAGTAGRWIFNTDDGMPNYDDGVNWRDINGNIT